MLGQLGLHIDRRAIWGEPDRLLATNLDAAPKASTAGVFMFDIEHRDHVWYWSADDSKDIPDHFTPNDLTACGPRRENVYVTDHFDGYIVQINGSSSAAPDNKDYRVLAKIKENFFPADPSKLETEGHIVNGIECMSDDTLLVAFMTPPGTKGKILRVDMETGEYAEVPLPDVDGTGMFSRFDGFYKEDETTLWATTNTGNGRVLKIVATDPGWTAIEAVFAREPTSCDTGDNGPTTGVLVRDTFVTSGDKIEAMEKSSLKLVWPSGGGGGGSSSSSGSGSGGSTGDGADDYPHGLVATLAVFVALFGAVILGAGVFVWRQRRMRRAGGDTPYLDL
jgi:hypothetical protein